MKSYLDTIKKPVILPLQQDEEIIKYFTASYDIGSSLASTWRLGILYLTNKRLLFVQVRKILFQVLLSQIKTINIVKREWILGKKVKQLNIVREGRRVPYIAIKDADNWKRDIEERGQMAKSIASDPQSSVHRPHPEEVILKEKGSYLRPDQSMWRLGTLLLTQKKIAFSQSTGIFWETPLSSIKGLRIEKRVYGVSKSDTICVEYESLGELLKAWIIALNLEKWRKELYERILIKVDLEDLDKIAVELDGASKEILWFLYENRHAGIDTLAKLTEAPNHMDVLLKIKEIINPAAEKIIGYPILSFESSRADRETGENVTFSWWLAGQPHRERRELLPDIFDEDDNLVVCLELFGITEDELRLSVSNNNKLIIDADKYFHKEIYLPAGINTDTITSRYNNNILEVKLKKMDCKPA
ncbi:Hsp20/alpha crystallin family protein [Desulfobacterium sp. N47]|uniref:Hsp20/alpha crystallin family protein n=1 Tax=Desulfobacterium sp. N47 TaxID=3115210 RepID=UPI003CB21BB3